MERIKNLIENNALLNIRSISKNGLIATIPSVNISLINKIKKALWWKWRISSEKKMVSINGTGEKVEIQFSKRKHERKKLLLYILLFFILVIFVLWYIFGYKVFDCNGNVKCIFF